MNLHNKDAKLVILKYPDGERKTYPARSERGREYDLIQPPHRERRLKIDRASSEERGGERGEKEDGSRPGRECSSGGSRE